LRGAVQMGMRCAANQVAVTYLLHDAGLALGEGNVPTRLVLDELDLDLSTLAARLIVVIVVVVLCSALALSTAAAIAEADAVAVVVQ